VFHGRHSPYFVGLEKGFYREAGFDVAIAPATGSGFVITALEGGKADYGMAARGQPAGLSTGVAEIRGQVTEASCGSAPPSTTSASASPVKRRRAAARHWIEALG
jgi:ABC-type nitrate/sulfonate/bicarbonate transport system substrate-binding protein